MRPQHYLNHIYANFLKNYHGKTNDSKHNRMAQEMYLSYDDIEKQEIINCLEELIQETTTENINDWNQLKDMIKDYEKIMPNTQPREHIINTLQLEISHYLETIPLE